MSVKKPEEMSLDELKAKEKSLQLAMGLFGIILILITAVGIYMDVNIKGSVVFIILKVYKHTLCPLHSQDTL